MRTGFASLSQRFAFADYHRRLDVRAVIEHYDPDNVREETNEDGTTELIMSCPLDRIETHHANADQSPSFACNLDKKTAICYSGYWAGDIFNFIRKMERKGTLDEIVPILSHFLGDTVKPTDDFYSEIQRLLSGPPVIKAQEIPAYSERILASWALYHPYLAERGIDLDTASRLHIGWDENENRVTIPVWLGGRLIGWQKRAIPDRPGQWLGTVDKMPKYRNSLGFVKSEALYGIDLVTGDSVVVVESPMSVIKAHALGVPNVVATFGASISQHQINLLKGFKNMTIWLDDDAAGRAGERKVVRNLYEHTSVRVVKPDLGKDLADYQTRDEVVSKIQSAVPAVLALREWSAVS